MFCHLLLQFSHLILDDVVRISLSCRTSTIEELYSSHQTPELWWQCIPYPSIEQMLLCNYEFIRLDCEPSNIYVPRRRNTCLWGSESRSSSEGKEDFQFTPDMSAEQKHPCGWCKRPWRGSLNLQVQTASMPVTLQSTTCGVWHENRQKYSKFSTQKRSVDVVANSRCGRASRAESGESRHWPQGSADPACRFK